MMQTASVDFIDGRLFSKTYNDFYASKDAIGECQQVHIVPANLASRMRSSRCFTVFEFGFGAGINFLSIAQCFFEHSLPDARLRFFSCEAHPLKLDDLRRALDDCPTWLSLKTDLIEQFPPAIPGIHRILLADDRIELTLYLSPMETAVSDFLARDFRGVDAWVLDGFAPDRNPQMWNPEILRSIHSKTMPSGTLTTFTVAGTIRRILEDSGFAVEKIEGHPYKRETTLAQVQQPSFKPPTIPSTALVVGGGIAGCATAHALARRGVQVILKTLTGTIADATSAIPTAILHARFSMSEDRPAYIRGQAYFFSRTWISGFEETRQCGALHLEGPHMSRDRLHNIAENLEDRWAQVVNFEEIENLAGIPKPTFGVYFPRSCVVNGKELCRAFSDHSNITVAQGKFSNEGEGEDPLVLATGANIPNLSSEIPLEITQLVGQVDEFEVSRGHLMSSVPILKEGYIAPTASGVTAGSTYEYKPWRSGESTRRNLQRLVELFGHSSWNHKTSFRGARAVTSDRLPICGYFSSNKWINLGHGSSGTVSAPFCGEIVSSMITHEVPPLWSHDLELLLPERFAARQLRRPNPFLKRRIPEYL